MTFNIRELTTSLFYLLTVFLATFAWIILFVAAIVAGDLGFTWFVVMYLFVLKVILVTAIITASVHHHRLALLVFLTIGIVLCIIDINAFVYSTASVFQALTAGFILSVIALILWAIAMGVEEETYIHRTLHSYRLGGPVRDIESGVRVAPPMSQNNVAPPQVASHGDYPPLTNNAQYSFRAQALYPYQANPNDPQELSFEEGEVIDVVQPEGKWWQGRRSDGTVGVIPSNFFQLL
ncbi:Transmembrane osmosensor [Basidiobolus ranarum]|uniref:Transmembrane osmosensor n=1 Tax=Basidiobolus ranarum TaxID=34480 RepID=A0ABR2WTY1_9FUNG